MTAPLLTGTHAGTSNDPYVLQSGQTNITLISGAYYVLQNGATLNGVTLNGASLELQTSSAVTGQINFAGGTPASGSQLRLDGTSYVTPGTTYFSNNTNSNYSTFQALQNAQVTGFGANDAITLSNATIGQDSAALAGVVNGGASTPGNDELYLGIKNANLQVVIPFYGTGRSTGYSFPAGTGGPMMGCFLRGTHIMMPGSGEVAVEHLRIGDEIMVLENGTPIARPIKWIGVGHMNAAGKELSVYPVRIRAGAFAENVPHRDLLLTNEHCIYIDSSLVPVRMLVNGQSIAYDRELPNYEYYHLELEQHGIILSEGLTTESYLSGTNREMFDNVATAPTLAGAPILAAPLVTDREIVEPIWSRLLEYGRGTGLAPLVTLRLFHDNPRLRLLLDDGTEMSGDDYFNGMRHFRIPKGRKPVSLLSNVAVPADVIGPFVDDRRKLGVGISHIHWAQPGDVRTIGARHLDLPGWHVLEGDSRWTNGAAQLDLPHAEVDDAELWVNVIVKMSYPAGILQGRAAA